MKLPDWLSCRSRQTRPIQEPLLFSNANYSFATPDCRYLTNITLELIANTALISNNGFSLQLNKYAPPPVNGPNGVVEGINQWQQAGFLVDTNGTVWIWVDDWQNVETQTLNYYEKLFQLPSKNFPDSWLMGLCTHGDSLGNVIEIEYCLQYPVGTNVATTTVPLSSIQNYQPFDLAPIVSFSPVLVGPDDGLSTNFSEINATMNVKVDQAVTPIDNPPKCAGVSNIGTAEGSNVSYSVLDETKSSENWTQNILPLSFIARKEVAVVRRQGRRR